MALRKFPTNQGKGFLYGNELPFLCGGGAISEGHRGRVLTLWVQWLEVWARRQIAWVHILDLLLISHGNQNGFFNL